MVLCHVAGRNPGPGTWVKKIMLEMESEDGLGIKTRVQAQTDIEPRVALPGIRSFQVGQPSVVSFHPLFPRTMVESTHRLNAFYASTSSAS